MPSSRTIAASIALAALLAAPARADGPPRGVVLSIDGDNIYVDLGSEDGVAEGSELRLHHVIEARHPATGKKVRDQFLLGTLRVSLIGRGLAVASAPPALRPRVAVGDRVELASPPVAHVDPWREPSAGQPIDPYAPSDTRARAAAAGRAVAADRAVAAAWRSSLGVAPAERIRVWQRFLSENPRSPHARAAATEITALERRLAEERAAAGQSGEDRAARMAVDRLRALSPSFATGGPLAFQSPRRAYQGSPVAFSFLLVRPGAVGEAWLYHRPAGAGTYRRIRLARDGDGYLRAVLPGDRVAPPGVEYFVEVLGRGQPAPSPAFGSESAPLRVAVDRSAEPVRADIEDRSRVSLFVDLVDFDGLASEWDQYLHGEVDFMYRFFRPIYSLRLGFGTMSGTGGPKDVIDADPGGDCMSGGERMCRKVGFNFGYAELELRLGDLVAVMARPQFGSAYNDTSPSTDEDREFFQAFGVRGRVRIGHELGSNLLLGASTTRRLGKVFEGAFTWDVIPRWPIVLSVQVTDQPVVEDYGVRLISDIGWRGVSWLYPSLRLAYQARDIDHAGASLGAAVNFDW